VYLRSTKRRHPSPELGPAGLKVDIVRSQLFLFGMRTEPGVVEQAKWTGCVRSEGEAVILKQARGPFTAKEAERARGGQAEEEKGRPVGGRRWDGCVVIAVILTELEKQTLAWELLRRQEPPSNHGAATGSSFLVR
jgi:hypothetical protein